MMRIVSESWKGYILINSKSIGMSHIIRVLYLIVISNELWGMSQKREEDEDNAIGSWVWVEKDHWR